MNTNFDPNAPITPEQDALNLNAQNTVGLKKAIMTGRSWEGALVGMVKAALDIDPVLNAPGWKRYKFLQSGTVFEFETVQEWIASADGLYTSPEILVRLLEDSPDADAVPVADQLRSALQLPHGGDRRTAAFNTETKRDNVTLDISNRGNSKPYIRKRIRDLIPQLKAGDERRKLAEAWLAKLEAEPRSRQHQQALRDLGMAADCASSVNISLERWPQLKAAAEEDGVSAEEWVEDVLHCQLRQRGLPDRPRQRPITVEAKPKPTKMNFNPETAVEGDTATNNVVGNLCGLNPGTLNQNVVRAKKAGDRQYLAEGNGWTFTKELNSDVRTQWVLTQRPSSQTEDFTEVEA